MIRRSLSLMLALLLAAEGRPTQAGASLAPAGSSVSPDVFSTEAMATRPTAFSEIAMGVPPGRVQHSLSQLTGQRGSFTPRPKWSAPAPETDTPIKDSVVEVALHRGLEALGSSGLNDDLLMFCLYVMPAAIESESGVLGAGYVQVAILLDKALAAAVKIPPERRTLFLRELGKAKISLATFDETVHHLQDDFRDPIYRTVRDLFQEGPVKTDSSARAAAQALQAAFQAYLWRPFQAISRPRTRMSAPSNPELEIAFEAFCRPDNKAKILDKLAGTPGTKDLPRKDLIKLLDLPRRTLKYYWSQDFEVMEALRVWRRKNGQFRLHPQINAGFKVKEIEVEAALFTRVAAEIKVLEEHRVKLPIDVSSLASRLGVPESDLKSSPRIAHLIRIHELTAFQANVINLTVHAALDPEIERTRKALRERIEVESKELAFAEKNRLVSRVVADFLHGTGLAEEEEPLAVDLPIEQAAALPARDIVLAPLLLAGDDRVKGEFYSLADWPEEIGLRSERIETSAGAHYAGLRLSVAQTLVFVDDPARLDHSLRWTQSKDEAVEAALLPADRRTPEEPFLCVVFRSPGADHPAPRNARDIFIYAANQMSFVPLSVLLGRSAPEAAAPTSGASFTKAKETSSGDPADPAMWVKFVQVHMFDGFDSMEILRNTLASWIHKNRKRLPISIAMLLNGANALIPQVKVVVTGGQGLGFFSDDTKLRLVQRPKDIRKPHSQQLESAS